MLIEEREGTTFLRPEQAPAAPPPFPLVLSYPWSACGAPKLACGGACGAPKLPEFGRLRRQKLPEFARIPGREKKL